MGWGNDRKYTEEGGDKQLNFIKLHNKYQMLFVGAFCSESKLVIR